MQIEVTPNLFIAPCRASDAAMLVELLSDEEIYRQTLRIPHPYTPADAEKWLAMATQQTADTSHKAICAIRQASGELIGGIGLHHRGEQWSAHRAEIGYWLARPYWGQGS
jgi:RimJ/RimL family protein N-acetyltransferase